MNSFCQNNRYRRPGTGLLAGFLFFFAVNVCSAMIHVSAVNYGVNGSDGLDDSPAFQSAINALFTANPKGGYLYIPDGTYDFDSLVSKYVTGGYGWTITIQGQSKTGVVLRCNNTNGVFRFTYQGRAENLTLRDVTFKANVAGAGTAFESSAPPPGGTPADRMGQIFNVDITYSPDCYFNNGFNLAYGNRTLVDGCTISSPVTDADMSDSSINFRMKTAINLDGSYNAVVRNCAVNGAGTAASFAMTGDTSTEGGTCMNLLANYVRTGMVFSIETNNRAGLEIRDCDITARDCGIKFYNRHIWYIAENTFRRLSPDYPLKDIRLETCQLGTLVRNTFAGTLAGGRKNVSIDPNQSQEIIIGQNTLSGAAASAIEVETGATQIVITGNNNVTGPVFTSDPFQVPDTPAWSACTGSIAAAASDADGDALVFCKAGGPDWLKVALDGTLSGIPGTGDIGTNVFTVRAMDDGGIWDDATMHIAVMVPPVALTSPTNKAVYTLPDTIDLAATVTTNDVTINKVQFYYNATNLIGEDTTAPYTFAWTNAVRGSYTVTARLVYNDSSTANSAGANITLLGLPELWQTSDIGSGNIEGSAIESNGVYTVNGTGNFTSGTADNFRFVYRPLSGDGEIRARIPTFQTGGTAQYGVMIRDNLTSASKMAHMGVNGSSYYYSRWRASTGGSVLSFAFGTNVAPDDVWVRLVRTGDSVTAYKSADGANWISVNTNTVPMSTDCYVGLCVAFGTTNVLKTGTFDNVLVADGVTTNTGTPEWWLAQYGLTNFSADAVADADGDGLLTWQEYIAGTNPTNPASVFQITGGTANSQNAVIRWSSESNRFYNLSRTTNLLQSFAAVTDATNLPATPPENVYTNPVPDGAAAFYKINVHQ